MVRQLRQRLGMCKTSPKLWAALIATLIAAIIATLLTRFGFVLDDADEELLNAFAPVIAGLLTGYWWDNSWDWRKAVPTLNLLAVFVGAVAYWLAVYVAGNFEITIDTWWKEVLLASGPIILGVLVGWVAPNSLSEAGNDEPRSS